jgi:hypothetical protein
LPAIFGLTSTERQEPAGQGLLPGALAGHPADLGVDHGVWTALADRDDPHLRESRAAQVSGRLAGISELGGVVVCVRGVPLEPVDAHQPPSRQERAPGQQFRDRLRDLPGQLLQRLVPEPLPGLGDPARGRHAPRGIPAVPQDQGPGQPGRDLLVILLGNSAIANKRYTITCGGSFPSRRFAFLPVTATAPSTASPGTEAASTPRVIWSASGPPATTPLPPTRRDLAGYLFESHVTTRQPSRSTLAKWH